MNAAKDPDCATSSCAVARRAAKERREFLHQPDRALREQQEDAQEDQAIDQEGNVVERSNQLRDHKRDQRADQQARRRCRGPPMTVAISMVKVRPSVNASLLM